MIGWRSLQKVLLAVRIAAFSIIFFKIGVIVGFIYLALALTDAALDFRKFPRTR
jgi:hypothetical protein